MTTVTTPSRAPASAAMRTLHHIAWVLRGNPLTAVAAIGMANVFALPVSTTHVLSSGVAGTMVANRSGLQGSTVRNILMAWVLTLPASMALSAGLFWLAHLFL